MRKTIFLISFFITIIFLVVISIPKSSKIKITLIPAAYQIVKNQNEDCYFVPHLFINKKKSLLTSLTQIKHSTLEEDGNIIPVELKKVDYIRKTKISGETFYEFAYHYNFSFPQDLYLKEAKLNLSFGNKMISFSIGSISYYNINVSEDYFYLKKIAGFFNQAEDKYLTAILLNLAPIDKSFTISNLEILEGGIKVNKATLVKAEDLNKDLTLEQIIKREYKRTDFTEEWEEIIIEKDTTFVFPLTYTNVYSPNTLVIRLIINYQDELKIVNLNPFCFFWENNKIIYVSDLIFYEISFD